MANGKQPKRQTVQKTKHQNQKINTTNSVITRVYKLIVKISISMNSQNAIFVELKQKFNFVQFGPQCGIIKSIMKINTV